jgi:hypothetical protein
VSVTSLESNQVLARDPLDSVSVKRQVLEQAGFRVCYTPTLNDADHHTVILPEPVTDEIAARFNKVFGRPLSGPQQ